MTKAQTTPATKTTAPAPEVSKGHDVVVEPSKEEATHTIKPRSPVKFKANIYGVGGMKTVSVEGVGPLTAVKLKMGDLPGGVTITGVESGENSISIRWSSSVQVNAMISGEVSL